MMARWTKTVIQHRLVTIGIWLAILLTGLLASAHLREHLSVSLETPGSQSAQADAILNKEFGENTQGTFTVIYKYKESTPAEIQSYKEALISAVQTIEPSHITQQRAFGGVLIASIATSLPLLDAAALTDTLRKAILAQGLNGALVTGPPAINRDVSPVLAQDLRNGQIGAIAIALFFLVLILGISLAVLLPILFAAASISLTLILVYFLAQKTLMVLYIPNIVELIGLGIAIDYSLLIIHRFRREIKEKPELSIDEAISNTMNTAGQTVLISGTIVSIALTTLLLIPVPFVRSLGAAGLVVPLTAVLTALTLVPAVLSCLGRRVVSTFGYSGLMSDVRLLNGAWARVARFVTSRPKSVFIGSCLSLLVMASSIFALSVTPSSLTAIPANLESSQALTAIVSRIGPGVITPHEVVIDLGADDRANLPDIVQARKDLSLHLSKNSEVFIAATDGKTPFVNESGRFIRIFVVGRHILGTPQSDALVRQLRAINLEQYGFSVDAKIYLGGAPAQGVDLIKRIALTFPWVILLALLLTYVLLARTFRSLILPLKAIALDLISIAVACSSLVAVFKHGFGSSLLQTYRIDQIEVWVLVFLFAILFGLSMDYEIFLVSRMREAIDRGATNTNAIIEGMAHTGGVVSAAAIIFVSAISGFVMGHFAGLQQLGVGLGIGVLVDATIIRGLLLPSAMVLLGRWNWWLPETAAKYLKVKASPLDVR
jgi:RND superfamily putative drug exporter